MYISSFNKFEDVDEVLAFMQRYSFATIVTTKDGLPVATHLPFVVAKNNDKIVLRSHFAKANPQCVDIVNGKSLVIFTEPHAYISPKNYEKDQNVPTWNYIAVHAYGNCSILDDEEQKEALLIETIKFYEAGYLKQYDRLTEEYKQRMMSGIVAFEIVVDNLQAKKKLSQNRTKQEQANIVDHLTKSDNQSARDIAAFMSSKNR
ncbi:MAG TPA: FMN-binding negative transcriptional regulator [Mucilaginibacter sp.]|nr:FMN-binding negative transcriptional regulator [Mucilaginibacter sp.]